jgi:hypothetical protein
MPLSDEEAQQGWIHGDQVPRIPAQELEGAESDAFLQWLFSGLARRPRPLSLRKGAVACYLMLLAWEVPAGEMRGELAWLGDQVGKMVLDYAPYAAADKHLVVEFLEEHADTYLATIKARLGLDRLVDYTKQAPAPSRAKPNRPPNLVTADTARVGKGNPHLKDDLSERIYVGFYALRRAGISRASRRVAEHLNRAGRKVRTVDDRDDAWNEYSVRERIKEFGAKLRRQHGTAGKAAVQRVRDSLVDRWLWMFRVHHTPARHPQDQSK